MARLAIAAMLSIGCCEMAMAAPGGGPGKPGGAGPGSAAAAAIGAAHGPSAPAAAAAASMAGAGGASAEAATPSVAAVAPATTGASTAGDLSTAAPVAPAATPTASVAPAPTHAASDSAGGSALPVFAGNAVTGADIAAINAFLDTPLAVHVAVEGPPPVVRVVAVYRGPGGRPCRRVEETVTIQGRRAHAWGNVCQRSSGRWALTPTRATGAVARD
jgi:hypothetical protein